MEVTVGEEVALSVGVFIFVACIAVGIVGIFIIEWWENR